MVYGSLIGRLFDGREGVTVRLPLVPINRGLVGHFKLQSHVVVVGPSYFRFDLSRCRLF